MKPSFRNLSQEIPRIDTHPPINFKTRFPKFYTRNIQTLRKTPYLKKLNSLFGEEIKKESENLKKSLDGIAGEQMDLAQKASEQESITSHPSLKDLSKSVRIEVKPNEPFLKKFRYLLLFLLIACIPLFFGKMFFQKKADVAPAKKEEVSLKNFQFETTPPDCNISINGEAKGRTPYDIILPLNQHFSVTFEKDGYQPLKQDILTNADSTHFVFEMMKNQPVFGAIKIDTSPSGAKVFVDGKNTNQTTPTMIDELPFQKEVQVSLQKDGYRDSNTKVLIAQASQDLHVDLKRRGPTLKINVVPSNSIIFLNGKEIGKLVNDLSKSQTYLLRVESKG